MNTYLLFLILLFAFIPANAADQTNKAVESQRYDQSICFEQRVKQCLKRCQQTGIENCVQLCSENARNECREAGE